MIDFEPQITRLDQSGLDVLWQGKASEASIENLESLLGIRLPPSFRSFLRECGGGGVVGEEISGIESDDPSLAYRGTVYGDTTQCREDYGLPDGLIVL